jgi:hypothetical protein
MYVLNTWYVAAWSNEVDRKPVKRVICEQPLVLFPWPWPTAAPTAPSRSRKAAP